MTIKCSHPDCTRQLTGSLDTYGEINEPLCERHWWLRWGQAAGELAPDEHTQTLTQAEAESLAAARLPGMESADA